ncbi:Abi family protein [Sporosarcina sp. JAI121]|uniref:Abi family protein n=1 Tax=Sporosarcina sp. JAI121 TaxID=2723064 RepID=UPI0015C8D2A4|nr:abortive infection bacteriophage resistance protein [Sporosarcina sp. JAI121]
MATGKQTDGLMRHLRSNGISIGGSKQKKELLSMGYYHGYKGYRFIKTSSNPIAYTKFEEVVAVYNFDMNLKTLFYPYIMTIETALKNYIVDTLVSFGNVDLDSAFKRFLDDYKSEPVGSPGYKFKMKDRLNLRKKIDTEINFKYPKDKVITHFLHSGDSIPLWAIFETLDMGSFGLFLKCLNEPIRIKNCENLNLTHRSLQQDGRLVQDIIFCLKGLRNSVAHNNVIFDCRFASNTNATNPLKSYVSLETSIRNIDFVYLVDYFILTVLLLKKIGKSKIELKRIIKSFREETESLRTSIPLPIWNSIMGTNLNTKLVGLENYI